MVCAVPASGAKNRGNTAGVYTLSSEMFLRGDTIGKYRIVSPLGSGGFGDVYLAEDTWIDKKVALKVPHSRTWTSASSCASRDCSPA